MAESTDLVFYDGSCALCHGAVRFIVKHDRAGVFRFAPLGGATFRDRLADSRGLPDSLVVVSPSGDVITRSDAVLHILRQLSGPWRTIAACIQFLPRGFRDGLYDAVARARFRIFGREPEACPRIPEHLRSRFLE